MRNNLQNAFAESFQAVALDLLKRPLADNEPRLEIIAPVDEDQRLAVVDVSERLLRIALHPADAEPEHIYRNAVLDYFELRGFSGNRVTAVAADHQVRQDL